jgi:GTP 3',8-cyclase
LIEFMKRVHEANSKQKEDCNIKMKDKQGRNITYMRISVTDKCNLRCTYCMPEDGVPPLCHNDIMTVDETIKAAKAGASLGISKIRITGGEPLVRKGIVELCRGIAEIPGIDEICMTTNGTLLSTYALALREAGVDRLNISLDTLNPQKYKQITRIGDLEQVLDGIRAARDAGFDELKINVVLMAGFNDEEIHDFVDMTRDDNLDVRFIELMPIGSGAQMDAYVSCDKVLETCTELVPLQRADGVAELYQLPGGKGRVGLIRAISCKFCEQCNKIRLTADGNLKPCLHSEIELSIRGLDPEQIKDMIGKAIHMKPEDSGNLDQQHPSCAGRSMHQIGG